ncbi:ly-6/neurotoxin-like protein 1 [Sorex fumeus]|uniref:ly-6/neurotoxin-like protein 1 n=1 Tax=Sorex fumeus TaxID=62283 RepID=UPI0024ACE55A|nr:ly-6/neurotoxin-like protein 1 [Sorex fumeus]
MGRMRTVALLLLLAFQCLDGVWALKCHTCRADSETCAGPMQCASEDKACFQQKHTIVENQAKSSHTKVVKTCVPSCENPGPISTGLMHRFGLLEFSLRTSCCTTDLCNAAPSQGIGAATVGMMLLAPVLAALLGDFL